MAAGHGGGVAAGAAGRCPSFSHRFGEAPSPAARAAPRGTPPPLACCCRRRPIALHSRRDSCRGWPMSFGVLGCPPVSSGVLRGPPGSSAPPCARLRPVEASAGRRGSLRLRYRRDSAGRGWPRLLIRRRGLAVPVHAAAQDSALRGAARLELTLAGAIVIMSVLTFKNSLHLFFLFFFLLNMSLESSRSYIINKKKLYLSLFSWCAR